MKMNPYDKQLMKEKLQLTYETKPLIRQFILVSFELCFWNADCK